MRNRLLSLQTNLRRMFCSFSSTKKSTQTSLLFFIVLALISFNQKTWAWGNRGHHSICEAAVYLTKEPNLHQMLIHKTAMIGNLCNIPDTYWKSLGSEANKLGNPTHFLDTEIFGIKVKEIPLDYQQIVDKYTNTPNKFQDGTIFSVPAEFGSNWWRAEQFYKRAIADGSAAANAEAPGNAKEEQNDESVFNKSVYSMIVNLGLLGHFVGDNGQPFHTSADYDGYKVGHGGIHVYYEEEVVAHLPVNLVQLIVDQAKKMQSQALSKTTKEREQVSFLTAASVLEKMRELGGISTVEMAQIIKLDILSKPSTEQKEHGMSLRKPAERQPAEKVVAKFQPLIVKEMARSAALLAQLWDEAYAKANRPDLKKYRSYKYAFTTDFVSPDYLPKEKNKDGK